MKAAKEETGQAEATEAPRLELVAPYVDEENEQAAEGRWEIDSLSSLDWALMRLAALERQVSANEELAAERIRDIERRTLRLNAKLTDGLRFFRAAIARYAEGHREELLGGGRKKTRELIHGSVGWRKRPAGLEVKDAAALLSWAQQQPVETGVLRIKEEVALAEVKKLAKGGEVPPGCALLPESEELCIKTAELQTEREAF